VIKCKYWHPGPGLPDGYIFKPKPSILVKFGKPVIGTVWYLLLLFGIFCGHLLYFVAFRFIYVSFVICVSPILVYSMNKNLATLSRSTTFSCKVFETRRDIRDRDRSRTPTLLRQGTTPFFSSSVCNNGLVACFWIIIHTKASNHSVATDDGIY
jgi:hypothetical protein